MLSSELNPNQNHEWIAPTHSPAWQGNPARIRSAERASPDGWFANIQKRNSWKIQTLRFVCKHIVVQTALVEKAIFLPCTKHSCTEFIPFHLEKNVMKEPWRNCYNCIRTTWQKQLRLPAMLTTSTHLACFFQTWSKINDVGMKCRIEAASVPSQADSNF